MLAPHSVRFLGRNWVERRGLDKPLPAPNRAWAPARPSAPTAPVLSAGGCPFTQW